MTHEPNPELDLVLDRTVDVSPEQVFKAWTTPEIIVQWFAPRPWKTTKSEVDLQPGGVFLNVMESPDGQSFPGEGCILEVVENRKLVWTSTMKRGYRPNDPNGAFTFTAVITMEPHEGGTKYRALVIHGDAEARKQHEEMGFHGGWGQCFDQLVELVKTL